MEKSIKQQALHWPTRQNTIGACLWNHTPIQNKHHLQEIKRSTQKYEESKYKNALRGIKLGGIIDIRIEIQEVQLY